MCEPAHGYFYMWFTSAQYKPSTKKTDYRDIFISVIVMMKEECKLCSVNGWGGGVQTPTDFSISSLMRPAAPHPHVDPRPDAVLLSTVRWYNFKLGDYPLYTLHDYYASGKYRAPSPTCTCQLTRTTNK